jgi:hypothetical protein
MTIKFVINLYPMFEITYVQVMLLRLIAAREAKRPERTKE